MKLVGILQNLVELRGRLADADNRSEYDPEAIQRALSVAIEMLIELIREIRR